MTQSTDELGAQIKALEDEIREKHEQLVTLRKSAGPEPVDDYMLTNSEGIPVTLSNLFGDRNELIVVHNMGSQCPYCTLWADGFNGVLQHIEDRAAFVVVSPDPYDVQREFAEGRGWRFQMISDVLKDFTKAMGYTTEHDGREYMLPGYSTFKRAKDGSITRTAHDMFGPGDPYCSVWHLFGLLDRGPGTWQPKFEYS